MSKYDIRSQFEYEFEFQNTISGQSSNAKYDFESQNMILGIDWNVKKEF